MTRGQLRTGCIGLLLWLCCLLAQAAPVQLTDCNASQTILHNQRVPLLSNEASAVWLNRAVIQWPGVVASDSFHLYYSANGTLAAEVGSSVRGADGNIALSVTAVVTPTRFAYLADGVKLALSAADLASMPVWLRGQVLLVQENADGKVRQMTRLQIAGALDDWYVAAQDSTDLGVALSARQSKFTLWAPTAQSVAVCLYADGSSAAQQVAVLLPEEKSGLWSLALPANLTGHYYQFLVDVMVPGVGLVRNRVTDPYSVSLTTDSVRSYITRLDDPATMPRGWQQEHTPQRVQQQTDMSVYELHVRDFSINDMSVPEAYRGKYLAFTEAHSNGMQHLTALAKAGMTDIHLLPVFDFASVPENGCLTPVINPDPAPASMLPEQTSSAAAAIDCFNWGYDPYHFNAPEGSYASDAAHGEVRMREFRSMVMALHRAGLRVGMDVVYNHTFAAGEKTGSVLDRIVPGYYHRLNAQGDVEQSTCCANTATENRMMGKLLIDSMLLWAKHYHINSFRFDLMAHQPRELMVELKRQLAHLGGQQIQLIGEGWNFGEVADGARFVQASQLSLNGTGIGTFNDRLRDAVRGGSASDSGADLVNHKGYINGLANAGLASAELRQAADMVRVGLAGSLRDYVLETYDGQRRKLKEINYNGQPGGYVSEPSEVVNYVENHDNQTLFDINVFKLPADTSATDRVRVQMLGVALTAFSQGVAYFHAGMEVLRSKSLDGNSFNSGDWFNRLDWSYQDNYFATGLPPEADNRKNYLWMQPLLENPNIKPGHNDILKARDMFRDLIAIRASSSLFHLAHARDVLQRLRFDNVGPEQNGAVIVAHLDGRHYPRAHYRTIVYVINVSEHEQTLTLTQEQGHHYVLHPVQRSAAAADQRIAREARYEAVTGRFILPERSVVVWVE